MPSTSGSGWPNTSPVPIPMPKNTDHRLMVQEPAPTSTRVPNPYDRRMADRGKRPKVGNATSKSTLVHNVSGPPTKRRKTDHHASHLDHPKGKSRDCPVVIPDEEDIGSDELNIHSSNSRPSMSDPGLKPSSKQFSLPTDGPSVKEIAATYSSDPIEQFSPDTTQDRGGSLVSRRINQYESNDSHRQGMPKIDFRKENLKLNMKGKSKGSTFFPLKRVPKTQIRNYRPEASQKIPVASFFFNTKQWNSSPHQQHWMYTRNRRLLLGENSVIIIEHSVEGAYTMTLGDPNSNTEMNPKPIIQFRPNDHTKETITVKVDTKHPEWDKMAYTGFVDAMSSYGVLKQIIRSEQTDCLWQTAEQNASEELKHIDPPLSPKTRTALKRKAESHSPDVSVSHQSGFEAVPRSNPLPTQRNLRSRKKPALDAESVASVSANPDEVVLSYPAGLPGAVNITNADVERLNPGAFLNDTLIEFGLKVWLRDLEKSKPELVEQIHVFSSFFYKKFNSKKDAEGAYDSVRKWTNKFDIFRKRYIIVPINEHLHWYLAIIYEPEHVLKGSPKSPPRPQTRLSAAQTISKNDSNSSRTGQSQGILETQIEDLERYSEVEVERDLGDFQKSCSIEDHGPRLLSPQPDSHSDIYEPLSPSADVTMASPDPRVSPMASDCDARTAVAPPTSPKGRPSTVDAARFYQPARAQRPYGKKGLQTAAKPSVGTSGRDEVEFTDDVPKTYIFTFDSLGGRHPQAVNKLTTYLRLEAKYKKGIDTAGTIMGKAAPVPIQTNFCDCGIYLLHFARTFINDPEKYANIIRGPRPKSISEKERKVTWLVNKDFEPEGRQQHRLRIEALSKKWKRLRDDTQKQSEVTNQDESEGEIELVESDTGKYPKSSRKPQSKKTGPASRVRG